MRSKLPLICLATWNPKCGDFENSGWAVSVSDAVEDVLTSSWATYSVDLSLRRAVYPAKCTGEVGASSPGGGAYRGVVVVKSIGGICDAMSAGFLYNAINSVFSCSSFGVVDVINTPVKGGYDTDKLFRNATFVALRLF